MGKKKRSFIDKQNSITFKLVERSQNDPLFVDETAPQYVLVEKKTHQEVLLDGDSTEDQNKSLKDKNHRRREEQIKYGIYFDDDYDYLQHLIDVDEIGSKIPNASIDLEPKNQNVKPDKRPLLMLPSSVFESTVQEREDLNKKAALPVGPQLDWDPDIVEAMDDDFDFNDPNNQLDDDFVIQAMKLEGPEEHFFDDFKNETTTSKMYQRIEKEEFDDESDNLSMCGFNGSDDDENYDDEARDQFDMSKLMNKKNVKRFFGLDVENDNDRHTVKTSASTHFTEYSMSSSVVPRNDNLKTLDEQFEEMYIREYADDMDIGALGDENINTGDIDPNHSELMAKLVQEYQDFKNGIGQDYKPDKISFEYVRNYLKKMKYLPDSKNVDENNEESLSSSEESEREEIEIVDFGRKRFKDRFDCESILSTYSNTMYHPTILRDSIDRYGNPTTQRKKNHIRVDPRTGIPITDGGSLSNKKLTAFDKENDKMETKSVRTNISRLTELSTRPKDETSEERRQRKKELKELRAQRRMEKKANRLAFNEEKIRLHKADINKNVQKKVSVT